MVSTRCRRVLTAIAERNCAMDIGERKKEILRAVIESYVETAEPVGSKTVAADIGIAVSSATIRNEMAELESMGLLEQPHTSAGRIPSPQGYRVYVNELMREHRLTMEETKAINTALKSRMAELDRILSSVGALTARLTNYPAYALAAASRPTVISRFDLIFVDPNSFIIVVLLSGETVKNKLVHVATPIKPEVLLKLATVFNTNFTGIPEEKITSKLISSCERAAGDQTGLVAAIAGFAIDLLCEAKHNEGYISGAMNVLDHPEYRDIRKAQKLISYLSDEEELLRLPSPIAGDELKITIGPENLAEELRDSSVVAARYDIGDDMSGIIGVVGPTRMDYSKVAARLSYIARGLGWVLSGKPPQQLPGEGKDKKLGDDDFG